MHLARSLKNLSYCKDPMINYINSVAGFVRCINVAEAIYAPCYNGTIPTTNFI